MSAQTRAAPVNRKRVTVVVGTGRLYHRVYRTRPSITSFFESVLLSPASSDSSSQSSAVKLPSRYPRNQSPVWARTTTSSRAKARKPRSKSAGPGASFYSETSSADFEMDRYTIKKLAKEDRMRKRRLRALFRPEESGTESPSTSQVEDEEEFGMQQSLYSDEDAERLSARTVVDEDSPDSNALPMPPAAVASHHHFPPDPTIRLIWQDAIDLGEIRNVQDQSDFRSLKVQLGIERIPADTLSRYHLKGHMDSYDQPAICYPRYTGPSGRTRTPAGLKIIRRVGDKLEKESYPEPDDYGKPKFSGIFGYHMVTPSDRRVILTTNERDALAVYAATGGLLCLALPNAEKLDHQVLAFLEDFDSVHFWFPSLHEKHARDYASYLSGARCYIVTKKERPIELTREERVKEINRAIHEEAVRLRNPGFRSMNDVRDDVRNELVQNKTRQAGFSQWKRFDVLNTYLKGFRPCEMTVLTGGTGTGKTTFVCEYALDLYTQGVRTLFCSFEMPEEKILKWMLVQYAAPTHIRTLARTRTYYLGKKIPLHRVENHPAVEMWLDRFERTKGDLMVMKSSEFRDKTVTEIANAIREQVIGAGIQHVVIDNLQFLVNLATLHNDKTSAIERFHQQDRFVGLLRSLATDYRIHVTLVVHPRKVEGDEIDIQHIGGSSRVIQEADNVLAIQRHRDDVDKRKFRKYLYILKNRYGMRRVESDQIEMVFQASTYTHTLIDYAQVK